MGVTRAVLTFFAITSSLETGATAAGLVADTGADMVLSCRDKWFKRFIVYQSYGLLAESVGTSSVATSPGFSIGQRPLIIRTWVVGTAASLTWRQDVHSALHSRSTVEASVVALRHAANHTSRSSASWWQGWESCPFALVTFGMHFCSRRSASSTGL